MSTHGPHCSPRILASTSPQAQVTPGSVVAQRGTGPAASRDPCSPGQSLRLWNGTARNTGGGASSWTQETHQHAGMTHPFPRGRWRRPGGTARGAAHRTPVVRRGLELRHGHERMFRSVSRSPPPRSPSPGLPGLCQCGCRMGDWPTGVRGPHTFSRVPRPRSMAHRTVPLRAAGIEPTWIGMAREAHCGEWSY